MKLIMKSSLIFMLSVLPIISYADLSKYCPEGKNISSTQWLGKVLIQGVNFENQLFNTTINLHIPANDAPSVWFDNFNFSQSTYDASTKTLSCTYTATHHVYDEPSNSTWVTISNTGFY